MNMAHGTAISEQSDYYPLQSFPNKWRKRTAKPYGTYIIKEPVPLFRHTITAFDTATGNKKLLECRPGKCIPRRLCKMRGWNPWVETDFANQSPVLCSLEDLLKCKMHSTNVATFSSSAFKILMERKEMKGKKDKDF